MTTVRERVARAARAADRAPDDVVLVVVTKFFPASDVRLLADLGVRDVGENRHQEAEAKAGDCADLGLRWHFVGGLQSNKAAAVAAYADAVHSVDRVKLVRGLDRGAQERGRPLDCLVQVSLDPPGSGEGRQGAGADEVAAVADAVAAAEGLRLRGLMAVAPLGEDPARAFDRLAATAAALRSDHPAATWLSAGMSGDLEQAVTAGATHVRVGSAVLGPRPANQ
nr:YggS family pyridoxal phosphate-dependent enzyme [Nocardioides perillae]